MEEENEIIKIKIENNSGEYKKAILFGQDNLALKNFGNDDDISITYNGEKEGNYESLLIRFMDSSFESYMIGLKSNTKDQVLKIFEVHVQDDNGQKATLPIIANSYKGEISYDGHSLDIPYSLRLHKNLFLKFTLAPNTTMEVEFYNYNKFQQ